MRRSCTTQQCNYVTITSVFRVGSVFTSWVRDIFLCNMLFETNLTKQLGGKILQHLSQVSTTQVHFSRLLFCIIYLNYIIQNILYFYLNKVYLNIY